MIVYHTTLVVLRQMYAHYAVISINQTIFRWPK